MSYDPRTGRLQDEQPPAYETAEDARLNVAAFEPGDATHYRAAWARLGDGLFFAFGASRTRALHANVFDGCPYDYTEFEEAFGLQDANRVTAWTAYRVLCYLQGWDDPGLPDGYPYRWPDDWQAQLAETHG